VKRDKEPINPDEILDFEEVAFMSTGAQLLGVLKADVDYLGQVFGKGVQPKSISRIATLSSTLDLFFAGWINRICEQIASQWHNDPENESPLKGKVDGLFSMVYSGGDDLLILGPWDAIVDLAHTLYQRFRVFTCNNANITLSAGIVLVKPHFPIQRFAQLAGEQLEQSKNAGIQQDKPGPNNKDRITVFGQTARWHEDTQGFDCLLDFGKKLAERVSKDEIPRSFIYFLMRLYDQHFQEGGQNPMWVPKLHYALARRLSMEVIADSELSLLESITRMITHMRIPTSYVSLKLRRE
jgi:CRISPR-associated protein Csm1